MRFNKRDLTLVVALSALVSGCSSSSVVGLYVDWLKAVPNPFASMNDPVLATVNGQAIRASQFRDELQRVNPGGSKDLTPEQKQEHLNQMIAERIAPSVFTESEYQVSASQRQLLNQLSLGYQKENYFKKNPIRDEEMRDYFKKNGSAFRLRTIFVETTVQKNKREAERAAATLRRGGKIPGLKNQVVSYRTPPSDWDSSWIPQVYKIKTGDVLGPLASADGFFVIRKMEDPPLITPTYESVKDLVRLAVQKEKFDALIAEKRKSMKIEINNKLLQTL